MAQGVGSRRPRQSHLIFLLLFAGFVVAAHAPYLDLPFFWDEVGYFVPAALDLYQSGRLVPVSTEATAHPPLVMIYLALVWKLAGYSITAARLAMLLLASVAIFLTFLLAVQLCRDRPGVPALIAVAFTLASPLLYTQSMMVQLDMPAMLFTTLALLLFLRGNAAGSALACTALVLTKETGVVVPLVFLLWQAKGGHRSALDKHAQDGAAVRGGNLRVSGHPGGADGALCAIWFLMPVATLTAWFVLVWSSTGHWFGSAKFTDYNLLYMAHPFRLAVSLLKRCYGLLVADFHWVGTAAILAARKRFMGDGWKLVGLVAVAHLLLITLLGGAQLERYLLPVFPIFYIAAAASLAHLDRLRQALGTAVMSGGLLAGLWWNPPYPFPYENNLAMTTFVELHRTAAEFVSRDYPAAKITTAWPLSDALRRPEFGYVNRGRSVVELPDFQPERLNGIHDVEVMILYSRDWTRIPLWEEQWRRYFAYSPPVTSEECQRRYGLQAVARWESRGQWVEVLARPRASDLNSPRKQL